MTTRIDYAFLHGGGQGSWVWRDAIAALRQQGGDKLGRTIALDIPGCGKKRGRNTQATTMDDIIAELTTDLESAGAEQVVLVGHSQAGTLLPKLTAARPELFRRLVYLSCAAPLPGQNIVQMMGTQIRGSNKDAVGWPFDPEESREMRERYRLLFCNDMDAASASNFLARLEQDAWPDSTYAESEWRYDHLDAIQSTYVICLEDQVFPAEWQETFAARLKVRQRVRIDAGHQVMNTRPQALAEVLLSEAS
jgi:pimeloyl-ACP methyl ester carboxylesterase